MPPACRTNKVVAGPEQWGLLVSDKRVSPAIYETSGHGGEDSSYKTTDVVEVLPTLVS